MNEIVVFSDGRVARVVGGTVAEVIAGVQGRQVSEAELKTDPWRLPKARAERKAELLNLRRPKFKELDIAARLAWENGEPPNGIKARADALRNLPPVIDAAIAGLDNTDAISAYLPAELS